MQKELLIKLARKLVIKKDDETYIHCLRKNLDMYLSEKGITINSLAEAADISTETLKTILYGNSKDCKLSTIIALANALDVTVDELVGRLDEKTQKSLRTYRELPSSSKRLIDWYIEDQEFNHKDHPNNKIVSIMVPEFINGNMQRTNDYEKLDITHLSPDLSFKIFFGIKIPCHNYLPHYKKGDVLLIANDRNPMNNENSVLIIKGNIAITKRKMTNGVAEDYGIRDGLLRARNSDRVQHLGYIAKVIES